MELKEVIDIFRCEIHRFREQLKSVDMVYREQRLKVRIEALLTAISHLETLQKVRESGGVKRRIVQIGDSDNGTYRSKGAICIHGINLTRGDRLCIECANDRGFNQALDLKEAELTRKLIKYYSCDNPNCGKGAICNYCALRKDLMGIF